MKMAPAPHLRLIHSIGPVRYLGLDLGVRVSDENEAPCEVYPDSPPCSCCRTIDAHHFRAEER